ncbi:MAG: class I tRNA ligase family protein, partial [Pseudomonadota bacterium]
LRTAAEEYDFNTYTRLLVDFCNEDLSAFFFDIRKDVLYCDGPTSTRRNAYRTVLDLLFHALVRYAAPVLVFTAEEVWKSRYPEDDEQGGSVHLLEWPSVPTVPADREKWQRIRQVRSIVNTVCEGLKREKTIRSFLEAEVELVVFDDDFWRALDGVDLEELFIVAKVNIEKRNYEFGDLDKLEADGTFMAMTGVGPNPGVVVVDARKTGNLKCGRCWRLLPDVSEDGALCGRCTTVVREWDAAAL